MYLLASSYSEELFTYLSLKRENLQTVVCGRDALRFTKG